MKRSQKIMIMSVTSLAILLLTPACSQQGKIQRAPNQAPANIEQAALKDWNEGQYREPASVHVQKIKNLSAQFKGTLFYHGSASRKEVALTFDDGPDNFYTPRILDILRRNGVHGTFFMVGKEVRLFPAMAQRIVKEGHAIGNHSWDHPRLTTISIAQIDQEVRSTESEIQRITGRKPDLFRPPYGLAGPRELTELKKLRYRVIDWTVDTRDWAGTPAPTILDNVQKEIRPGAIILEHCLAGKPGELNGTLEALPKIINRYKSQGYKFVTVDTLLQNR